MEDLNDKVLGTNLAAIEWNQVPSEIQNVIEQTGQTLTNADLNQLGKGVASYVANANFYTDSGIADAYILTSIGSNQSIVNYVDGMSAEFIAGNNNTGATTVNVATKGVKDIVDAGGGALAGGEIISGARILLKYISGSDNFIIDVNVPANSVLTGSITAWPVVAIPSDYLECDGAEISRTTFNDLFILLGVTYGNGNGSTTFNIPDLRGEFIRGFDNGAGNDPDSGSRTDRGDGTTGDNVGTKQISEFDSHSHSTMNSQATSGVDSGPPTSVTSWRQRYNNAVIGNEEYDTQDSGSDNANIAKSSDTGGNETRSRNVYMIYIIKI